MHPLPDLLVLSKTQLCRGGVIKRASRELDNQPVQNFASLDLSSEGLWHPRTVKP